jgi:hypothetical protein
MPNIFKRPMFRKGGSSSYGTGITSGLEPRQKFSDGPPEEGVQSIPSNSNMNPLAYEELINRQYQQMLPSEEQAFRNLITGLGSSAPSDPMQLQTFDTAFSKAGAIAAGLNREQIGKAEDFRTKAGIEAVKNLTAPEKDQIFRYAKERARILQIPENMRSPNDKEKLIFLDNELKKTQQYLREASPEAKIEDLARKIEKEEARNLKVGSAKNMAATKFKVEKGEIKDPRTNQPLTNYASRSLRPNEIIFQGDGSIGIVNPDKIIQQTLKTILSPNTIYITQQEGYLYLYEGNNKFRRIYP